MLEVDVEISLWVLVVMVFRVGDVSFSDELVHVFLGNVKEFINEVGFMAFNVTYCSYWGMCSCWGSVVIRYGVGAEKDFLAFRSVSCRYRCMVACSILEEV